jgi:hypothetical protein
MAMAPVSGKATVVGFTVNAQQWTPDLPPPYVIAIVALDEDDGARLTTNIVNCDPAVVRVGMRVRVLFEKAEEIYLPLFEPDPDEAGKTGPFPSLVTTVRACGRWPRPTSSRTRSR